MGAAVAGWTVAAVLLQVAGLSLFLYGFFPVKPTLPGFSGAESYRAPSCGPVDGGEEPALPPDQLRSLYRELSEVPHVYDRLVLMVIDGLPAEFVLGRGGKPPAKEMMESMPYTQSLLADCRAVGYHAKAAPPTVTMPRLKAMVSGAIGGFLDVALNFNTQAFLDDNLLDQLHTVGYKLVMLGDETWIKLFPTLFYRQDGVSSFYVKDTVEVDFNVSRHLESELAAKDWDALILHYLGLDHVGHIGGRQSNLMTPKLKEMDDVIRRIHAAVKSIQDNSHRTLLVVVSDHGMTEVGNHGGSSYEETDSLTLFIGHSVESSYCSPYEQKEALQVDLAPTLALLFGIPIPKNNIGVLLPELFNSLTDEQKLRTLELNSWQILRLLQEQRPAFCSEDCVDSKDDFGADTLPESIEEKLCRLLSKAFASHRSSLLHRDSNFLSVEAAGLFGTAVDSYSGFLRHASEWLSHRATDKPLYLLVSAISLMIISCFSLAGIISCIFKGKSQIQSEHHSELDLDKHWHLDEVFILMGILLYVASLGSSSFVEEEQYIWHFLTSTLYLIFLIKTVQSMLKGSNSTAVHRSETKTFHKNNSSYLASYKLTPGQQDGCKLYTVLIVLVAGRILRAWYQGGINWVHFPDISKILNQSDSSIVKSLQSISVFVVVVLYSVSLMLLRTRRMLVIGLWLSHLSCGLLVMLHIWKSQVDTSVPINHSTTSIAQIFYVIASISVTCAFLLSPWIFPTHSKEAEPISSSGSNPEKAHGLNHSVFLTGVTYTMFWCLLQLLLQQPINAIPVLLILLQIISSVIYFSLEESLHRQWVQVVAMQFLGMTGHFGLGNTNSLASIDVAGAFIGISSYSTVLSGVLMFIITYGSPLLLYLGMVVHMSVKDSTDISTPQQWSSVLNRMIALPCLLPLLINSIALTSYTIVLLLMRNHLFVWSVFSPKYLYVCAATVCTYAGVLIIAMTGAYTCAVFSFRTRNHRDKSVGQIDG
ncbi:GPI ethanolamine phosphate transferase 2-like isoform X1 [Triticum dicoccoides]|uniref:GPI ethanolamine phosphate transferase 2-like isoform X1 n=2 Tax=Triticum dicoccoides TaxID=85692 RepID=UPI001890F555|nr:GPI ethanolamine phosphate transferase 2-like isoform X1 [Triticum dicoccoides]